MKAYNAQITKENILNYFLQSGLTIEALAMLLGLSKKWLEYVFSGKEDYEFDPKIVQKACDFFLVDFRKFTTELQRVPADLLKILQKKQSKNTEYNKILSDPPSVPFIIENILAHDDEFIEGEGMELKFIKRMIRNYYPGLKLTNLSADLQNSGSIAHWSHPSKKRRNLYRLE